MKWERGEQTGVVHPSMLLPGNFFLHMSAMSDSRTPFRTKRQRREGGREERRGEWWVESCRDTTTKHHRGTCGRKI